MSRLVAMQPYFLPYLGYFSLLVKSDVFVVLDEDQYVPRRWMNRTKISSEMGKEWLTIPISGDGGTRIPMNRCVVADDTVAFQKAERKYSELVSDSDFQDLPTMRQLGTNLVNINMQLIEAMFEILKLDRPEVVYWSNVKNSVLFEGDYQNRAVALTKVFDCRTYLNASGGRPLYEKELFSSSGLNLEFMEPFVETEIDTLSVIAQAEPIGSIAKRIIRGAKTSE